ncbi:MAG: hypothetical protein ACJ8ER_04275 [Allosphingosinicella sp.]
MPVLGDHLAFGLWEEAAHLAPVDRAVRTLAAVAGIDSQAAADWPVDERDRALIEARCRAFGPAADFYVHCPSCGEALETRFDLEPLLALEPDGAPTLAWSGRDYALRAPTSREVARAARAGEAYALVRACIVGLDEDEEGPEPALVEASLDKAFPLLNVSIGFTCASCDTSFSKRFDAPAWLWTDIERLARALIDEVHLLAAAYGWTEEEILGLGRRRRAAYLARLAA